jgi:hypothetical protein
LRTGGLAAGFVWVRPADCDQAEARASSTAAVAQAGKSGASRRPSRRDAHAAAPAMARFFPAHLPSSRHTAVVKRERLRSGPIAAIQAGTTTKSYGTRGELAHCGVQISPGAVMPIARAGLNWPTASYRRGTGRRGTLACNTWRGRAAEGEPYGRRKRLRTGAVAPGLLLIAGTGLPVAMLPERFAT